MVERESPKVAEAEEVEEVEEEVEEADQRGKGEG